MTFPSTLILSQTPMSTDAALPAPDGWVLVPREARDKAVEAMAYAMDAYGLLGLGWTRETIQAAMATRNPSDGNIAYAAVAFDAALPIIAEALSSAPPPPSREGWLDEDTLTDILTDSLDMDWNPRDGAKAILRYLERTRHERS